MEEWVGRHWDGFIRRVANRQHAHAAVELSQVQRSIGMMFRAAGGAHAVRITAASDSRVGGARDWLQRIAGSGTHAATARLEPEALSLPPVIAVHDDVELNRALYLWLAAQAAFIEPTGQWIADNLRASRLALLCFPGLSQRYRRLLVAELALRPDPGRLRGRAARAERVVRQALSEQAAALAAQGSGLATQDSAIAAQASALAGQAAALARLASAEAGQTSPRAGQASIRADHAGRDSTNFHGDDDGGDRDATDADVRPDEVAPVWLWLAADQVVKPAVARDHDDPQVGDARQASEEIARRRRASAVVDDRGKAPLMMFFRAESILSWGEFVKVDRASDDDENDNASTAANDMDELAIASDGQTSASRVKFDLDLPSAAADDRPMGPGLRLPEWDYRRATLIADHCALQTLVHREPPVFAPPASLRATARRVRRRLDVVRGAAGWSRSRPDGDELDLDAWVRYRVDAGASPRDESPDVYSRRNRSERSLATLLLADLSLSTDAYATQTARVIDVIRDALYVFGEALSASGDPFEMMGFSSVRRQNVRIHHLKGFDEDWSVTARNRVGAIKPGYYTRMGAAIRMATRRLGARSERQRILLLLTDGKPNDLDVYEGRYGLEDTRHALRAARNEGIVPFCITIDESAHDYLPLLFGQHGYALVHRPQDLPDRLTGLYLRFIQQSGH